jgi:hypothetical protein
MKTSIAFTLIITAAIFSFVSGYSIGSHSDQAVEYKMASQSSGNSGVATSRATENPPVASTPAGGYGSPSGVNQDNNTAAAPGYGNIAPGAGK